MALTDTKIRNAKPGRLTDGHGLYLLVKAKGKGWWRLDYKLSNSRKTLSMGTYPEVSLAMARTRREEARQLIASGIDPSEERKAAKAASSGENSFETIAREWHASQLAKWSDDHAERVLCRLKSNVFPMIGARPISELLPSDLIAVVKRIEKRGAAYTAKRARSECSKVFCYAIAHGRCERDPAADIRGAMTATKTTHFASIQDPKKVGPLLRAIEGYEGHFVTKSALKLTPLVFARPGELRHAEWTEIDFDKAEWRIPAKKMKSERIHIVPLSKQALSILRELHELTGQGKYLFPGIRTASRPISENTVNAALRRMGYSKEEMTGHGFRSMASTLLNEKDFNRDWIERQLAHGEKDSVRAAYNYAEYLPERRRMMQEWADYLESLR